MNKIIIAILLMGFMLPMVLASDPAFIFKQNQVANITLQVLNSDNSPTTATTDCYLSIKDKDLVLRMDYQAMTFAGNGFYTKDITGIIDKIGLYSATLNCENAAPDYLASNFSFEVTPSGFQGTLGFTFVIVLVCASLVTLGFWIKDGWFVVFGGLGLIGFGIYSVINGIAGFKDDLVTWGTSLFFIGVGAYLAINSAIQMIDE